MLMRSANTQDAVGKYGFPYEFRDADEEFRGTQKGIRIGVVDADSGDIIESSMPGASEEEKAQRLHEALSDRSLLLLEKRAPLLVKNSIVNTIEYYVPYYNPSHSVFSKETVLYGSIEPGKDNLYIVSLELLFVEGGFNRYCTISYGTRETSVLDMVDDFFGNHTGMLGTIPGLSVDVEHGGLDMDFYSEIGEKITLHFPDTKRFKDTITGIRMVSLEKHEWQPDEREKEKGK